MRYSFDGRPAETAGALRLASRFGSFSMRCDPKDVRERGRAGVFPDRGRVQGRQQSLWRHRLLSGLPAPRGGGRLAP
jgi:hypothetical protein